MLSGPVRCVLGCFVAFRVRAFKPFLCLFVLVRFFVVVVVAVALGWVVVSRECSAVRIRMVSCLVLPMIISADDHYDDDD